MKKTKLISLNPKTAGETYTLPVVGDVTFDKESNSIEVDEDQVNELLKLDFGLELTTEEKSTIIELDENSEEVKMLRGLNDKELNDLLKGYDSKLTKRLKTKDQIITFLAQEMQK